jgi:uncharacterized protein YoxC
MPLLKIGDHGSQVAQLQNLLNGNPSRLPRLIADGRFGVKTQARVIEFQADNGLKQDGIAGDRTFAKLQGGGGPPEPQVDLQAVMLQIAGLLDPVQRPAFLGRAQSLVPRSNTVGFVGELAPVVIIILFFIIMMMFVVAQNSTNPKTKEMGREWERRFNRLKEQIRGKPVEVQTAETLQETKRMAKDVSDRATSEREKCLSRLDPAKLIKCERAIKILTDALQSLAQKIRTGTGGGITPESLVKGIGVSVQAVFAAARAFGECTGCDNMFL